MPQETFDGRKDENPHFIEYQKNENCKAYEPSTELNTIINIHQISQFSIELSWCTVNM